MSPLSLVDHTITLAVGSVAHSIDVISDTPISAADLSVAEVPVPVQTLSSQQLEDVNALDLADAMNKRMNGVYVNENADNPFEPDINYRGYEASPLLGTPEGLSVYFDGVRQNQPFGDIVAWDLIPKAAIADAALIPGSDPIYGLNTLGGAIAVRTRDGLSDPGLHVEVSGGSFNRRSVEGRYGASHRSFDLFAAGTWYDEDGWRVLSPSQVRQSFAKLRWLGSRTTIALSGGYAINALTGNGLQDFRTLNKQYNSVYSVPDITWDHAPSLTLNATHQLTGHLSLSADAYARHVRNDTTNGDINDDSFDQSLYNLSTADQNALKAAGYSGYPLTGNSTTEPFPYWRCIAQALEKDEPSEKCTAIITNTRSQQSNYGLSGVVLLRTTHNRFAVGGAWDRSNISYGQLSQFGYLNPDGITITAVNAYADGTTNQDGSPVDTRVQLHGNVNTGSFYATDTATLGRYTITASGRYNHTTVNNLDRLPPSAVRGTLTAINSFQRFNPAFGAVYHTRLPFDVYADYSEASRAPTSIELGCADPNFPCNLPNALVSDPPLQQVISRTVEAGIRSHQGGALQWSAGWFRGENHNDLLFLADQQLGFGYFSNFGNTLRQGIEIDLSAHIHAFQFGGGYTFLNATYNSPGEIDGGSSSANVATGQQGLDHDILITPGNHIPQIPQHMLKVFVGYNPTRKLSVDLDVDALSGSYARGNENNLDQPDNTYYLGPGSSPAYGVANLGARYQLTSHFQLFAQANNLLNQHYYTAAQLGDTPYDNNGVFTPRPFAAVGGDFPLRQTTFFSPGAPVAVYGGLRIRIK